MIFFAERLKVQLREQGARHDLVDAVFALEGQDDLLLIVRRVEALGKFLDTEDGKNLLAGYKRATNIIRIEEKKDNANTPARRNQRLLYQQRKKRRLRRRSMLQSRGKGAAVADEDFEAAMRAMAKLRPHVDAFFDKVTVNVDEKPLRENRLKLLNEIRAATRAVADFSRHRGITRMDTLEIALRLGLATLVGAALGLNREIHGKPTGVRTLGLVGLGSALAVMAAASTGDIAAPSRVMQGIVTGIGFLGAGVILRPVGKSRVHGLTTAACTWLTAAFGIACAVSEWRFVLIGVVLAFAVLLLGGRFEKIVQRWSGDEAPGP